MTTTDNRSRTASPGARCALALPGLVFLVGTAHARTAGKPWQPPRKFDNVQYLKNQWRINVSNYGTFGYSETRSGGGEWPAGSGDMYIYGAGIWIGTLKRSALGRDTLVSVGSNPHSGIPSATAPRCCVNTPRPSIRAFSGCAGRRR